MRTLYDTLSGDVVLEAEGLTIRIEGDGRGHLAISGEVLSVPFPSWGPGVLRFTMPESDHTLLSLQPVLGED